MKRTKLLDLQALNRRNLMRISAGGCAAMTNTSLISTIMNMSATNSAVAQGSGGVTGYKAMVCMFLYGGNDSYNMLSPATGQERADYLAARGGEHSPSNTAALGLPENASQNVTDSASGRQFMLHPSMPQMKDLYNAGKAAFVCNIGSLVEPTTMAQYNAGTNLPLGLFSHADLQQHWMTSVPQTRSQVTGWAGRMADLVTSNTSSAISMNISIDNVNMMQTGGTVVPYVIGTGGNYTDGNGVVQGNGGAQEVWLYDRNWAQSQIFTQMTDDYLTREYGNLMEKTFAQQNGVALDAAIEFNRATTQQSVISKVDSYFPLDSDRPTTLQRKLRSVARAIAASSAGGQVDLGGGPVIDQSRQSFFVSDSGYDNHDELIYNQANLLSELSEAIANFQACMDGLGISDDVVLFTASDFARTLNSNGKGSDHAWGGVSMIVGGGVDGGRMYGTYPGSLAPGNDLDLGRGRLLPTTSVDELAAELALWYGVGNNNDLVDILPNIRNFFSTGGGGPLGALV